VGAPGRASARASTRVESARTRFGACLDARRERPDAARLAAEGQVVASRAARDMAKERFLDLYAEIAAQIRSEFPRDRDMQDLFFDTVIHRARRVEDAPEDELPADPEGEDDAT
jgi:hypothetical protein